jgi:hypothetical protein
MAGAVSMQRGLGMSFNFQENLIRTFEHGIAEVCTSENLLQQLSCPNV